MVYDGKCFFPGFTIVVAVVYYGVVSGAQFAFSACKPAAPHSAARRFFNGGAAQPVLFVYVVQITRGIQYNVCCGCKRRHNVIVGLAILRRAEYQVVFAEMNLLADGDFFLIEAVIEQQPHCRAERLVLHDCPACRNYFLFKRFVCFGAARYKEISFSCAHGFDGCAGNDVVKIIGQPVQSRRYSVHGVVGSVGEQTHFVLRFRRFGCVGCGGKLCKIFGQSKLARKDGNAPLSPGYNVAFFHVLFEKGKAFVRVV